MFNKNKIFYLILIFMNSQLSYAKFVEHTKLWINGQYLGNASKKDDKIKYLIESRLRFIDSLYVFEQVRLSAGLGYEIFSQLTAFAGFGYVVDKSTIGITTHEDRPFQLLRWKIYKSKELNFSNQSLLEERKRVEEPRWAYRLREKFALEIPIKKWDKHSIELSNDFFFNLNHPRWVNKHFYAENRAVIGLGTQVEKQIKIIIGYINQYQRLEPRNRLSNGLIISFEIKDNAK